MAAFTSCSDELMVCVCGGGGGGGEVVKGVPPLQELKRVSGLHCTFATVQRDFFLTSMFK